MLWKTSCLVLVPKVGRWAETNDYRRVALTSHIMKNLEWVLLRLPRPQGEHALYPLTVVYQEGKGVAVVLYLLHQVQSDLDILGGWVRIILLDFLNAFTIHTIQPLLLRNKLKDMGVDLSFASLILTTSQEFKKSSKSTVSFCCNYFCYICTTTVITSVDCAFF